MQNNAITMDTLSNFNLISSTRQAYIISVTIFHNFGLVIYVKARASEAKTKAKD